MMGNQRAMLGAVHTAPHLSQRRGCSNTSSAKPARSSIVGSYSAFGGVLLVAVLVAPAAFRGARPVHKALRSVIERECHGVPIVVAPRGVEVLSESQDKPMIQTVMGTTSMAGFCQGSPSGRGGVSEALFSARTHQAGSFACLSSALFGFEKHGVREALFPEPVWKKAVKPSRGQNMRQEAPALGVSTKREAFFLPPAYCHY